MASLAAPRRSSSFLNGVHSIAIRDACEIGYPVASNVFVTFTDRKAGQTQAGSKLTSIIQDTDIGYVFGMRSYNRGCTATFCLIALIK